MGWVFSLATVHDAAGDVEVAFGWWRGYPAFHVVPGVISSSSFESYMARVVFASLMRRSLPLLAILFTPGVVGGVVVLLSVSQHIVIIISGNHHHQ
jgi:hypothetical protein